MTLRDGTKSMIYKDGNWIMTYTTSDEYTLHSTLSMYSATWQVTAIKPHEDNVYTYTLVEIENKPDDTSPNPT